MQKLSALSSSLARVVSSVEEEEAQLDQFPVEGVWKPGLPESVYWNTQCSIDLCDVTSGTDKLPQVSDNFSIKAVFIYLCPM